MNVEIGTETPIFLFWVYLFLNFGILSLQCRTLLPGTLHIVNREQSHHQLTQPDHTTKPIYIVDQCSQKKASEVRTF
jgi:hypothetical protein